MIKEPEVTAKPWYSERWVAVVGAALGILAVAILSVAAIAYFIWLSSPEKVLLDGVQYAKEKPATYHVTAKDTDLTVRYDGTRTSVTGTHQALQFTAVIDGMMLYVKSSTPAELVKLFTPKSMPADLRPVTDSITSTITNRWVSVPIDRVPFSGPSEISNTNCGVSANSQLITNKKAGKELASTYDANRFLAITTTADTDKSKTFKLSLDKGQFRSFMDALVDTRFYQSLSSQCSGLVDTINGSALKDVVADVTVNDSPRAITGLTVTGLATSPLKISAEYGSVGTITIPNDPVSYDSISSGVVQTILKSLLQNR